MHTEEQLKASLHEIGGLRATLDTERKQSASALSVAKAQLDQLLAHSPGVLYVLQLEGGRIMPQLVSENITRLLGFSVSETLSNEWWLGQLHPDDRKAALDGLTETTLAGSSQTEYRLRHKDGHYCWIDDARRLICDPAGSPAELIGVWTDITDRKKAEEILRQASGNVARNRRKQVRLELAILAIATISIYVLAARFNWFEAVTSWFLANEAEQLDETILTIIFIALGLAVFAFRRWREAESELTSRQQVHAARGLLHEELDRQVRQRTGELDTANQALRAEVSERRRTEAALRENEERFSLAFRSSPAAIAINRRRDLINLEVNDAFLRLFECSRADIVGHSILELDLVDKETVTAFSRQLSAIGEVEDLDVAARSRTGRPLHLSVSIRVIQLGGEACSLLTAVDITERKQAEMALRASEGRYRTLFDYDPDGIVIADPSSYYIDANASMCRMLGYSRDEFIGLHASDIVVPAETPHIGQALNVIKENSVYQREWLFRRKDSSEFAAEVIATMMPDGNLLAVIRDITERKLAESALKESNRRFQLVVENIREVFWMADTDNNRILYVSPGYEAIWGRTCESLYAEPAAWIESVYPEDRDRVQKAAATKQMSGDYDETYRITRPDGAVRWIRDRAFPIHDQEGAVHRVVGTAEDVTKYRILEEQFRQAQKMEAIGTLAGGIAHDFNNILAAINGYTELARMTLEGNSEVREHLDAVLQATSRAIDLVRQILAFSRQQQLERGPIQLRSVVEETLKLLRATIPSTIEFEISLASDTPTVFADASQIHQILMNLGTNAWHAMKDGPGRLQVKLERCVVDAAHAATQPQLRPGVYARVSVSDTGCGMEPATLRRIFEPFFTTKPTGKGTGLGLAVVHGIMNHHDGAVTVYSQPGEGTVFYLYFPAHAGEPAHASPGEGAVPRGHGERILVVDDEELLVRLGQATLTSLGYEVEIATQPAAALAMVLANPQRFALVLTDQTMPGMTGMVLASQLLEIRPGLPIILMTGYSASLTTERVQAAGIRQLLIKPAGIHSIGTAVATALGGDSRQL